MNNLNEVINLHKNSNFGISSNIPKIIIKIWYIWQIYINRSCFLIKDIKYNKLQGFLLFDINKKEIVFISCRYKRNGCGSKLLQRLEGLPIYVKTTTKISRFYFKNGFKKLFKIDNKYYYLYRNKEYKK